MVSDHSSHARHLISTRRDVLIAAPRRHKFQLAFNDSLTRSLPCRRQGLVALVLLGALASTGWQVFVDILLKFCTCSQFELLLRGLSALGRNASTMLVLFWFLVQEGCFAVSLSLNLLLTAVFG